MFAELTVNRTGPEERNILNEARIPNASRLVFQVESEEKFRYGPHDFSFAGVLCVIRRILYYDTCLHDADMTQFSKAVYYLRA